MTQPSNRLTREQWIALLEDYASSGLSVRQYAGLKNVGYSTLTKWAALTGISLKKNLRQASSQSQMPSNEASLVPKDQGGMNPQSKGGFAFIDVTNYARDMPAQNAAPTAPRPVTEEPVCPLSSLVPCRLEIHMPNGVMLKVDQVSFPALWLQITEFVKAVSP